MTAAEGMATHEHGVECAFGSPTCPAFGEPPAGLPRAVPVLMRVSVWWHRKRNPGHHSMLRRVSVPMFDPSARGYLIRCSGCERTWAA